MIINAQDIINALTRLERVVHERDPRKTAAKASAAQRFVHTNIQIKPAQA